MTRWIALVLVLLLAAPSAVLAQGQPASSATDTPAVDASKMGVSLSRIRRELVETQVREQVDDTDPLRLQYNISVVGIAPKIDFLQGFNVSGPLPYGSPTHGEVLDQLTPKEFRSPTVPIYGLAVVAAQKLWQYNKKKRCEAELEEYRRLIMQGVAIAAPSCTQ